MKALILAAGFGTRLENSLVDYKGPYQEQLKEWVQEKPKGLVPIKGKPLVNYQIEQLQAIGINLDQIYVHTNDKHYSQYLNWAKTFGIPKENVFNN